jgi:putative transcriptional regulator
MSTHPFPHQIRALRQSLRITQTEAAQAIMVSLRAFQQWEGGQRKMPEGMWLLLKLRTAHIERTA